MALKKSQLYSSLWSSCDELRGGMDASQYKDYVLTLLFMKYVSDKYAGKPGALIEIPDGGSFADMVALKGKKEIGDQINKIIGRMAEANDLRGVIDVADFNDEDKLGRGKEMQDRLSKLVAIFEALDFRANRAEGDDLLGDAYEYLMRHFATESGKSKGQFYTPAEVSQVLARVVGIGAATTPGQTIYDPTCGSGSLLLKAADEAPHGVSIYGQEMDNSTWALARMNMILHDYATAEVWRGNTLAAPHFKNFDEGLKTFDFAVANPPFSTKAWTSGLDPEHDKYGRFAYGIPPAKNGDYAFLLHIIKSLKSDGKAAIILPHGVLFRGHREGDIRRELIRRGLVSGVIGLPPNLFYGTSIPACVVVIDRAGAASRTGVFMIDASHGFVKDGNKNRLRSQDIHRIVDAFTRGLEIPGYSRMVPVEEISSPGNTYNLNIPRYIDSSEPEDIHDLEAHIHGGIPTRDIDDLSDYWQLLPSLRDQLFEANGQEGYSQGKVDSSDVALTIFEHPEFVAQAATVSHAFEQWKKAHEPALREVGADSRPKVLIEELANDLLDRFTRVPLLNEYDVYQRFMDYCELTMQDDLYLITSEGWVIGRVLRVADEKEPPDFAIKRSGEKKTTKLIGELIPAELIIRRYFREQREAVEQLEAALVEATERKEAFEAEHRNDEGVLVGLDSKAAILERVLSLKSIALETFASDSDEHAQAKQITKSSFGSREWKTGVPDEADLFAELDVLHDYLKLIDAESRAKKEHAAARVALYDAVIAKYPSLDEDEIRALVVDDKWFAALGELIDGEMTQRGQSLADRVAQLEDRYAETLPQIVDDVERLSEAVRAHLQEMGVTWN
jgi:type I restriction enzyme M protein